MTPKPISIQFYTVRDLFAAGKVAETIEEISEIGFSGVEGIAPGFTPTEWKKWLDARGMVMSSNFGALPTLDNLDEIRKTLDEVGTRNFVSGFWIPQVETVDAIKESAASVREGIDILKAEGINFSLHNHWFEFDKIGDQFVMDLILNELPDINLELDIYWASNFGAVRAEEMARKYANRIKLMHVKDGPLVRDEAMVALGEGKVNVPLCVDNANPDWLIIELDKCDTDMMTAVERSFNYLTENGLGYAR